MAPRRRGPAVAYPRDKGRSSEKVDSPTILRRHEGVGARHSGSVDRGAPRAGRARRSGSGPSGQLPAEGTVNPAVNSQGGRNGLGRLVQAQALSLQAGGGCAPRPLNGGQTSRWLTLQGGHPPGAGHRGVSQPDHPPQAGRGAYGESRPRSAEQSSLWVASPAPGPGMASKSTELENAAMSRRSVVLAVTSFPSVRTRRPGELRRSTASGHPGLVFFEPLLTDGRPTSR